MEITFRHLQQLEAIVRNGSFIKAASELNISQPALSRSISSLEETLNIKVFDRTKHRNSLTVFGKHLLEKSSTIIKEMHILERELKLMKKLELGRLKIGAGIFGSKMLLGPVLARFRTDFPAINITINVAPAPIIMAKLANYEIDIAFIDQRVARHSGLMDGMSVIPLTDHKCYFFCHKEHPVLQHKEMTMKNLIKYPLATVWLPDFVYQQMAITATVDSDGEGEIKRRSIICDDHDVLFEIVAKSNNVGLSANPIIRKSTLVEKFVTLTPTFRGCHTNLGIIVNEKVSYSPAMEIFQKYLIEEDQKLFLNYDHNSLAGIEAQSSFSENNIDTLRACLNIQALS